MSVEFIQKGFQMNHYIDLHMHSTYSDDGSYSPTEVVERCFAHGVRIMALTDHNSVEGVSEAQTRAQELGMTCIPAIEIDCTYKELELHVLGYGVEINNPIFSDILANVRTQDQSATLQKLELTNQLGFDLKYEDFTDMMWNGIITGEMFAERLLEDERYIEHPLLKPYREGGERSLNPYVNFYWDFYAKGKPCYVPMVYPKMVDIIPLIQSGGGVPVLAHPGNNLKNDYTIVEELIRQGIEGLEAFSNYHDDKANEYFYHMCRKHNLLVTCGSDFHGKTKPAIEVGASGCTIDPAEIEAMLKARHLI